MKQPFALFIDPINLSYLCQFRSYHTFFNFEYRNVLKVGIGGGKVVRRRFDRATLSPFVTYVTMDIKSPRHFSH